MVFGALHLFICSKRALICSMGAHPDPNQVQGIFMHTCYLVPADPSLFVSFCSSPTGLLF